VAIALVLRSDPAAPPVVRGAVAPAFELPLLSAGAEEAPGRVELAALRGRVVLVNFWAT
jgi:hypothetical protein